MLAGCENLARMPPIHTREVDRTGFAVTGEEAEARAKELDEFLFRHLA
jgi:hypothetical protein